MASRLALLSALPFLFTGCSERPKAPPLTNDAVYQNDKAGVRFLAPPGWSITSRSDLPPGPLEKPFVLVSYIQSSGEKPAEFEVLAADIPENVDLGTYLVEHRVGAGKWTQGPASKPLTVGGSPAMQYSFTPASTSTDELRREATAVRRGGRAFFFLVTCSRRDAEHHGQAVSSIDSVAWLK
jgi:hypothetical protein